MKCVRFSLILLIAIAVITGFCVRCCRQDAVSHQGSSVNWFLPDGAVNWEAEKQQKKIQSDTVVIHHTGQSEPTSWQQLSSQERERLYVPRFNSKSQEPYVKGEPVHSGHFRIVNGTKVEVFYAYHWLIRSDGSAERLLADTEVGWHSGNWMMNMRSVAICFDGDFSVSKPSDKAIASCARLIADYKRKWGSVFIVGHSDVTSTKCPGAWFASGGRDRLLLSSGLTPK